MGVVSNAMANQLLTDAEAKAILLTRWPNRTRVWPSKGHWIRAQPKDGIRPGPKIFTPGAELFSTQPDGLWVHFNGTRSCDLVAVEVCGKVQNLYDKRSRYIPASHSIVLEASRAWLNEKIDVQGGGRKERWRAAGSLRRTIRGKRARIPVRYLRVLYVLPTGLYGTWCAEHPPTGYEFFCPHSSLDSFNSQRMQAFLRQMSLASHFYTQV